MSSPDNNNNNKEQQKQDQPQQEMTSVHRKKVEDGAEQQQQPQPPPEIVNNNPSQPANSSVENLKEKENSSFSVSFPMPLHYFAIVAVVAILATFQMISHTKTH